MVDPAEDARRQSAYEEQHAAAKKARAEHADRMAEVQSEKERQREASRALQLSADVMMPPYPPYVLRGAPYRKDMSSARRVNQSEPLDQV